MPQQSYEYANARIASLSRELFSGSRLRRLLDGNAADAEQFLRDARYGGEGEGELEARIDREIGACAQEIRQNSPDPQHTDAFLLRADAQNLKILYKAAITGTKAQWLEAGGIFTAAELEVFIADGKSQALPAPFAQAVSVLRKAQEQSPQTVSIALDRAFLQNALAVCRDNAELLRYFRIQADFDNVLCFLRMKRADAGRESIATALLPEGGITHRDLLKAYDSDLETLRPAIADSVCKAQIVKAIDRCIASGSLAPLATARDDAMFAVLAAHRQEGFTVFPLLYYFTAKRREAQALRVIIAALKNRLPASEVNERLVMVYG